MLSIFEVKTYTQQQIFDFVCEHLMAQFKQATDKDAAACAYRTDTGLKCAVGCMIPDDRYTPTIEGQPVIDMVEDLNIFDHVDDIEDHPNIELLTHLQHVHDSFTPAYWYRKLKDAATIFALSTESLTHSATNHGRLS